MSRKKVFCALNNQLSTCRLAIFSNITKDKTTRIYDGISYAPGRMRPETPTLHSVP